MSQDILENPDETRERDERGRFLPGNVTSKTGRSPGRPPVIRHIRELARENTDAAFAELRKIALSGESESARVAAIKEIFDRGWGKAAQPHTGDGGKGPMKMVVSWRDPEM
jgi:hypothetical protein